MTPFVVALAILVLVGIALVALLGMAKWKSVIFSDIRNKLGEQVIFSMWKGRPYMRQYTVPANPQTAKQTGRRTYWSSAVTLWQSWISLDADTKANWDAYALPELISGFNKFVMESTTSKISCETTKAANTNFNVTYTLGAIAANCALIADKPSTGAKYVLKAQGTLVGTPDTVVACQLVNTGVYRLYIADLGPATNPAADPVEKKCLIQNSSYADLTGVITNATITIT
jgi:hypothetical protein